MAEGPPLPPEFLPTPKLTPPEPSPSPSYDRRRDHNEQTNPGYQVDAAYMKRKLAAERAMVEQALDKHDNKLTLRSVVIAIGALAVGVAAALIFIDNRVAAQTDAGVKVHEQRITTLEQQRKEDRVEHGNRMERIEQNQNADHGLIIGVSQKLDVLLSAQGVRNPAPTPKDGGR